MVCEIYKIGPDELEDEALALAGKRFLWFVYYYECYSWEGDGEAIGYDLDGLLRYYDLSHCSCYGPLEDLHTPTVLTVDEFRSPVESVHDWQCRDDVREKVEELLNQHVVKISAKAES